MLVSQIWSIGEQNYNVDSTRKIVIMHGLADFLSAANVYLDGESGYTIVGVALR